jgi:hypothetical protein
VAVLALLTSPSIAAADVTSPTILAGPSADLVELGGVALAADGTGGAIWRTVTGEGSHIYVARYAAGAWTAPQRVDVSLPYNSFLPRIAAAPGGHLVAMWVQDYAHRGSNVLYRLSASVLRPGARRFEVPWTVDSNVGTGQAALDALEPMIRLNDAGVGYAAYRVRRSADLGAAFPNFPGRMIGEFRVARYNRGQWSSLGAVNRNPAFTIAPAAPGNQPQVSVDALGNGVVAFLEPDAAGVERVWARRLFGARQGLVTKVSPTELGGRAIPGNAEAFALAGGALGAAAVIVRQAAGRPSPLAGTRLFVSRLPNAEQTGAQRFLTPEQIDDASGRYGLPAIAMDGTQHTVLAYSTPSSILRAAVTRTGPSVPSILAPAGSGDPQVASGPAGSGVVAYPNARTGTQGVDVVQDLAGGGTVRARIAAPVDGAIRNFTVAGSGLGDALVAFLQGGGEGTRLVVAAVQAPPQSFLVKPPVDFVAPDEAVVQWDRAASGVGGLVYDVTLGGEVVARGIANPSIQLPSELLQDGPNRVSVRARDASGQTATGTSATVNVDGTPPRPTVVVAKGRRVTVRLSDPLDGVKAQGAGVDPESVFIRFGDGTQISDEAPASHRYARPGRYRIRVRAADALGNVATTEIAVRVR